MDLFDKIRENRILLHTAYWVLTVIFFGTFWGTDTGDYGKNFTTELVLLPPKIAVTYFVMYFAIPKYLFTNHYIRFAFSLLLPLVAASFIMHYLKIFIIYPVYPPDYDWQYLLTPYNLMKEIVDINTLMVLPVMAKIFKNYYKNKQTAETLAKEKLQAELKFLKSQIHPHFLFNTLNSLYSLTLKKSDSAPEVVLKISNLMRYILHEANENIVPLTKEIDYIKNYIDLEKLRYQNRLDISFNVYGEVSGVMIAPMMILPFVENCFKHGVSKDTESTWVTIEISVKGDYFILKVENSIPENTGFPGAPMNKPPASGIGLRNVERRLDLIYKDRYDLKITNDEYSYHIQLRIDLNEKN